MSITWAAAGMPEYRPSRCCKSPWSSPPSATGSESPPIPNEIKESFFCVVSIDINLDGYVAAARTRKTARGRIVAFDPPNDPRTTARHTSAAGGSRGQCRSLRPFAVCGWSSRFKKPPCRACSSRLGGLHGRRSLLRQTRPVIENPPPGRLIQTAGRGGGAYPPSVPPNSSRFRASACIRRAAPAWVAGR